MVELGTGQIEWETLGRDRPTVELIFGAQGGFHIWGRLRMVLTEPDVEIAFRVTSVIDGRVLHSPQWVRRWIDRGSLRGLRPLMDGRFETEAELVLLDLRCASELVGRDVILEGMVRDRASGRALFSAQRRVEIADEVPTPPPGCASIDASVFVDASRSD
ncbi:MAG: hypothetical protein Q8Q09_12445 [Deltaproteobacteria bacterium]|nr:hypothetical protein [Deltaproteobacteria bacterium]